MVLLCRHHHRLVHEGGFSCERTDDGRTVFRSRGGEHLDPAPTLSGTPDDDALGLWFGREFFDFDVDGETCTPRLHAGETMNWDLAVSHMFPR